MADAVRGRHITKPHCEMLGALGKLRKDLRQIVGEAALEQHGSEWFDKLLDLSLRNLPEISKRRTGKQSVS